MAGKLGLGILAVLALVYLAFAVVVSLLAFPVGLFSLLGLLAFALLFAQALQDRLGSAEDDYYDKSVQQ
jgi:hypothetical protein